MIAPPVKASRRLLEPVSRSCWVPDIVSVPKLKVLPVVPAVWSSIIPSDWPAASVTSVPTSSVPLTPPGALLPLKDGPLVRNWRNEPSIVSVPVPKGRAWPP